MRFKTDYECRGIREERRMIIRKGQPLLSPPPEEDKTSREEHTINMIMGGPIEGDSNRS